MKTSCLKIKCILLSCPLFDIVLNITKLIVFIRQVDYFKILFVFFYLLIFLGILIFHNILVKCSLLLMGWLVGARSRRAVGFLPLDGTPDTSWAGQGLSLQRLRPVLLSVPHWIGMALGVGQSIRKAASPQSLLRNDSQATCTGKGLNAPAVKSQGSSDQNTKWEGTTK